MRVAEENGINAFHFAEVVDGVFRHRLIRIGRQTRVRHDDHQIGAFLTHLRHILTCSFGNVVNRHFAAQVGLIPGHDLRRYKTDIANLQGLRFPVLIDHGRLFDQIRGEQRLIGFNVDDIGVNVREFGPGERHMQIIQPVVKLVVAEVTHRVVQGVQRLIDRMHIALFQTFRRHVIAKRTTLN